MCPDGAHGRWEAVLMPRQTWVHLLIWLPADPWNPLDVSQSWPRVLQVVKDGTAAPPGVVLRPGESLRQAAARVTGGLGLRAPLEPPALLAIDQRPPERGSTDIDQLVLVLDGGTLPTEALPPCSGCGQSHLAWTATEELGQAVLVHALRTRLLGQRAPTLWRGELITGGSG